MGEITGRKNTGGRDHPVILHVDMDAFFASVEVLDDPSLAGRPVVVGGLGTRGVVAACTYEARAFGVHSAMPTSVARRHCSNGVFLPGRYHRYVEVSRQLHEILHEVTPAVEGISLDEAFLDVTASERRLGDATTVARSIHATVEERLKLPCSVGGGRTKLVAKLASKQAKPVPYRDGVRPGPGVVVVEPEAESAFLHPLPISALWGVGPVTSERLDGLGLRTIGDVAGIPPDALVRLVGRAQGRQLAALARGDDPRPVVPDREAKSIGHEETFADDVSDAGELRANLLRMVCAASSRMRGAGLTARTVTVKVRFGNFTSLSRSHTVTRPIDTPPAIAAVALALLESVASSQGVRLLGIGLSGLSGAGVPRQLALDVGCSAVGAGTGDDDRLKRAGDDAVRLQQAWTDVTAVADAVRTRYGQTSVGLASQVGAHGIEGRRWGPASADPPPARGGTDGG